MKKVHLQERYQLFIGGQWKDASDHETFKTICPADGNVLAECAQATKEEDEEYYDQYGRSAYRILSGIITLMGLLQTEDCSSPI